MHHALQSMHDETMYRRSYISCMSVGVGTWWRGGTMGMYISYRINANVHTNAYISYHINANVYIISYQCEYTCYIISMRIYISYRINANVHIISYRINGNVQGIRMHPTTNNKHSMMHRTSWITYTLLQKCGVRVNSCHEGEIGYVHAFTSCSFTMGYMGGVGLESMHRTRLHYNNI